MTVQGHFKIKKSAKKLKSLWPLFLLILFLILLRIPNFFEPYWYSDEGFYLTIGQALSRGVDLYEGIFDHKTPILYWLASLTTTLHQLKLILLLSSLFSTILFYFISLKLVKSKLSTFILTSLFIFGTTLPRYEGNIVNGELILMPFVLFGVLLFWSRFPQKITSFNVLRDYYKNTNWLLPIGIGFSFSLAVLTKVPAIFELGVLGLFLTIFTPFFWHQKNRMLSVKYGLQIILGFAIGMLASTLVFIYQGTFNSFINFGLLYNFRYIQDWDQAYSHPISMIISSFPGRAILIAIFLLVTRHSISRRHLPLIYSLTWFVISLFAATISLRPYPHYLLQTIPAFLLTLGLAVRATKKAFAYSIATLVIATILVRTLNIVPYKNIAYYRNFQRYINFEQSVDSYINWFDSNTSDTYDIAQWISDRTISDQEIYIHGDKPILYALTRRPPATKYTAHFHVRSMQTYSEVIHRLENTSPKYIIDYHKSRDSFPELYSFLDVEYIQATTIHGVDIYKHQPSQ